MIRPVTAILTVSIHAFRGEGDSLPLPASWVAGLFQSTPSGGKATRCRRAGWIGRSMVSIHAFRGEGDARMEMEMEDDPMFQSTPSGGKATCIVQALVHGGDVSIHAFRGEGDSMAAAISAVSSFQSTPSGGKATASRARRGRGRWCFNPRLPGGRRP